MTEIDAEYPADTFFPDLSRDAEWQAEPEDGEQVQDGVRYRYVTYRRR